MSKSAFRLFSWRGERIERLPSRNAAISSILSYNTVRINVEVSVPAVSTARRTPEGGALPLLSSDLVQRFKQCRGGMLKLAFRLFPWRGERLREGALPLLSSDLAQRFSQCRGGER